ncbi:ABC transporter substrate-binding protein [Azorhizobium doebereinerae]|uniref:ABC transporter substrate-binding protein n=1 Tax=Azorhizobium doebereinerae TaxID=281091 RepID=UPI00041DB7C7|nr:ABC transporter substrate-binding protein [Azorhizobium doebereinerae]
MITRRDMMRGTLLGGAALGGAALGGGLMTRGGAGGQAHAQQAAPFKVVAFAGASNLPFWVGQEKGFFAREGVAPALEITPNSVEMAKNLHAGKFDFALTSVDNIVAYDEGQGEADLPEKADFVALFGVDNGMLNIMAVPEVKTFADLKGKTLSVDAMTTGFAFVLRDILAKNGLGEGDVTFVKVGGGAQRLEALLKKEQAGTLLNTPLDLVAEGKGFTRLARASEALGAYQGIVGAARRDTAAKMRPQVEAFIRGFHASVLWLADPVNKEAAVSLLASRVKGMERPQSEKAYEVLLDPKNGIYRDLRIDPAGLATVLRLRSHYAPAHVPLSDPARYVDLSYLKAALKT